jgi:antitoxin component of MazEF toxin-antitoxin module
VVKKLRAIGNSLGIIIEQPILELLKITRETPLDVSTDGTALIIRPVPRGRTRRLERSAERLMEAHDATFRKLAK